MPKTRINRRVPYLLPRHTGGPKPTVPHVRGPDSPDGEQTLHCRMCGDAKPLRKMYKNHGCVSVSNLCKTCKRAKYNWRTQGFECNWDIYYRLYEEQGGKCRICGGEQHGFRGKRLNVDHNHVTGKIRGLLCHSCNVSIGHFNDDPAILRRVIAYLESDGALQVPSAAIVDAREPPRNGRPLGERYPEWFCAP